MKSVSERNEDLSHCLTAWEAHWLPALLIGPLIAAVPFIMLFHPGTASVLPLGLIGIVIAVTCLRRPLVSSFLVVAGFAFVAESSPGMQAEEVAYAAFYLAYVIYWYGRALLVEPRLILRAPEDYLVLGLLAWIGFSLSFTFLHGGHFPTAISELAALSMLTLFFPLRDICVRYKAGPYVLIAAILFVGIYISLDKIINYQEAVINAIYAWQVARGRVAFNETLLLFPAIVLLVLATFERSAPRRFAYLFGLILTLAALIITQSRAFWVAFVIGAAVLFLFSGRAQKIRLVWFGVFGVGGTTILAYVLLGEEFFLLAYGIVERFVSLGSATSDDISLVNRFYESAAVWDIVRQNPILGYGLGSYYQVYDIIDNFTMTKSYVHNGYLGFWYRFGLVGLLMLLAMWTWFIVRGVQAFRASTLNTNSRGIGISVAASLIAIIPSAAASVAFYLADSVLPFILFGALASGLVIVHRARSGA